MNNNESPIVLLTTVIKGLPDGMILTIAACEESPDSLSDSPDMPSEITTEMFR